MGIKIIPHNNSKPSFVFGFLFLKKICTEINIIAAIKQNSADLSIMENIVFPFKFTLKIQGFFNLGSLYAL